MQDIAHVLGDRQFDAVALGQPHHFIRGLDRFDHLADRPHRILDGLPLAQCQAQAAVAREVAGAGQHQIAQAGQAHQGFRTPAQRDVHPQHLVEAAGDQAGTGIQAQPHAVGHAGGHRQHVLHRPTQLRTAHVVAGVGAERGAVQCIGHLPAELGIVGMHGQCGRQAFGDFLGERRPGDHRQRHLVTQDLAGDFMQEAAAAGFEALGRPRHPGMRRTQRRQCMQGFGEGVRGHHHQHQVGIGQRFVQRGGGAQVRGQGDAGQVAGVLAARFDRRDVPCVPPPQHRRVVVPGDQRSKRGAPGPRAQYCEFRLV